MSIQDYFDDPHSEKIIVLEVLKDLTNTDLYAFLSDRPYATESADSLPGSAFSPRQFNPVIQSVPEIRAAIRQLHSPRGSLEIGRMDVSTLVWDIYNATAVAEEGYFLFRPDGSQFTLKLAAPRRLFPYSDAITLFTGRILRTTYNNDFSGSLELAPDRRPLLQSAGSLGCYGYVRNVTPRIVDFANQTYRFHGNGDDEIEGIEQIYDRVVRLVPPGGYEPPSSTYDGATDFAYIGSELTGLSDGKRVLFSCWFRTSASGTMVFISNFSTLNAGFVVYMASGEILVRARTAGGTLLVNVQTLNTYNDGEAHHLAVSMDLAATSVHLYVDGVSDSDGTAATDDTIDLTKGNWAIGANVGGGFKFDGDLGQLYFETDYLDLSDSGDLDGLITGVGGAVDFAADGSGPTGSQPLLYAEGGDPSTNDGSAQNWSINGSLGTGEGMGPPAGWSNDLADGEASLTNAPSGIVTADVKGAVVGGSWLQHPSEIIEELAPSFTVDSDQEDRQIGYFWSEEKSREDVLSEICAGTFSFWYVDNEGDLIVREWVAGGTPIAEYDEDELIGGYVMENYGQRWHGVSVGYDKNWTVITDPAPGADSDDAAFASSAGLNQAQASPSFLDSSISPLMPSLFSSDTAFSELASLANGIGSNPTLIRMTVPFTGASSGKGSFYKLGDKIGLTYTGAEGGGDFDEVGMVIENSLLFDQGHPVQELVMVTASLSV